MRCPTAVCGPRRPPAPLAGPAVPSGTRRRLLQREVAPPATPVDSHRPSAPRDLERPSVAHGVRRQLPPEEPPSTSLDPRRPPAPHDTERRAVSGGAWWWLLARGVERRAASIDTQRPPARHERPTPRGPRRRGVVERSPASRGSRRAAIPPDRGSATLWCVALSAVLFTVATAFALLGTVRVAHHRAQSTADLSALVAARWALASPENACERASRLAVQNGARLVRCALTEATADVTVAVGLSLPGVGERTVHARARAGPAAATPALPTPSRRQTAPAPESSPQTAPAPESSPQTAPARESSPRTPSP
ncbi:Rv3654c family TadE-like protein [Nonomuraea sp. NPDC059194]|uniref:Rv3654c family TadE-like protein n=1 Tax=Nonomuraea sp. NPDC059194 TaxID=3346764 RepID=UPI00369DF194